MLLQWSSFPTNCGKIRINDDLNFLPVLRMQRSPSLGMSTSVSGRDVDISSKQNTLSLMREAFQGHTISTLIHDIKKCLGYYYCSGTLIIDK